ncbi:MULTISPECIES: response regulator [unclassified Polaribacter]|uniref:response regulator n=1 Tax=unclassified Polaribacter TaxID=196858 RepID=UPI0011BE80B2|nr:MULTISPECIES: response regulator [unclassified Polaribacter]TXD51158.1 response regulator [Polaribacter sp. IC063]TXD56546.1 response regulator [Polaribacter sp. IC066]
MIKSKLSILLIEQDEVEIIKLKKAISKESEQYNLILVSNTNLALAALEKSLPNIILLDLSISASNGIEFLSILKNNTIFRSIPVIVLTAVNTSTDIATCYKLGIAGCLLKPSKNDDYEVKINTILKYWSLNEFIPS